MTNSMASCNPQTMKTNIMGSSVSYHRAALQCAHKAPTSTLPPPQVSSHALYTICLYRACCGVMPSSLRFKLQCFAFYGLLALVRPIKTNGCQIEPREELAYSPPFYPSPWMNPKALGWEEAYVKAKDFVSQLTLLEKVNLTTGVGYVTTQTPGLSMC